MSSNLQWSWNDFVVQLYGLRNEKLIEITSAYLTFGDTKECISLLEDKFGKLRKRPVLLEGEYLEKTDMVEWDSFITYDQLFDIFPIEFLERYDMTMVRNWKLKKLMNE